MSLKFSEVKAGDVLIADGGFTCIKEGAELYVFMESAKGGLYVQCSEGAHFLDGQEDEDGHLVGLSRKRSAAA